MKKTFVYLLMITPFLSSQAQSNSNSLLKNWSGPYGGVPAFNEYKLSDFKPAIEAAIGEKIAEMGKIASNTKPAAFENTIVALEKVGKKLNQEIGRAHV